MFFFFFSKRITTTAILRHFCVNEIYVICFCFQINIARLWPSHLIASNWRPDTGAFAIVSTFQCFPPIDNDKTANLWILFIRICRQIYFGRVDRVCLTAEKSLWSAKGWPMNMFVCSMFSLKWFCTFSDELSNYNLYSYYASCNENIIEKKYKTTQPYAAYAQSY